MASELHGFFLNIFYFLWKIHRCCYCHCCCFCCCYLYGMVFSAFLHIDILSIILSIVNKMNGIYQESSISTMYGMPPFMRNSNQRINYHNCIYTYKCISTWAQHVERILALHTYVFDSKRFFFFLFVFVFVRILPNSSSHLHWFSVNCKVCTNTITSI